MDKFDIIFFTVFAAFAGTFLYKFIRHGGLKGAMFGAAINRTVGEVGGSGGKMMRVAVKVHTLSGGAPERAVGLELVAKTFASYQMMPVTLSASEAKMLASLLQSAAGENMPHNPMMQRTA